MIHDIQKIRPKKPSAAKGRSGFSLFLSKLIIVVDGGSEKTAMEVQTDESVQVDFEEVESTTTEPVSRDDGFFGNDDDFDTGFAGYDGDMYGNDDHIVRDYNLASPMYLEYLICTDISSTSELAPTPQPSSSASSSSPSPVETVPSIEAPSTPTAQLATPPTTPPNSAQKSPRTEKPAKPTPTLVGKLIHQFGKVGFAPNEVTWLGDAMAGKEDMENESLARDYKAFVASDAGIRDVSDEDAVKHVKRMLHVANYIVLSVPEGVIFQEQQNKLISLLFARSPEYFSPQSWLITVKFSK